MARNKDNLFDEIDEEGSTEEHVELETEPVILLSQRLDHLKYPETPSSILTCTAHLTLIWLATLYWSVNKNPFI